MSNQSDFLSYTTILNRVLASETLRVGRLVEGVGFAPDDWGNTSFYSPWHESDHRQNCEFRITESSQFAFRSISHTTSDNQWYSTDGYELTWVDCACGLMKYRTLRWEPTPAEVELVLNQIS